MFDIKRGVQIMLELSSMLVPEKQKREREGKKVVPSSSDVQALGTIRTAKELVIRRKGELEPIWVPNPP